MSVKKLLAGMLALAMVLTMASFPAFAADASDLTPVGVTSTFEPEGEWQPVSGIIDGVFNTASYTYFKGKSIGTSGDGTTVLGNFVFEFKNPVNLTEIYFQMGGANHILKGAVYGSNDLEGEWTLVHELGKDADLTWGSPIQGAGKGNTQAISHEGYYKYFKIDVTKIGGTWLTWVESTFKGTKEPGGVESVLVEPIGVTSPFTAAAGYSLKGVIDGSEADNPNFFRTNVDITPSGTKGSDANFNFTVDLGLPYNIVEFYSSWGSKYAQGVALWGSNDGETFTEIADITNASSTKSSETIAHEGYYRYIKVEAYKILDNNARPACKEVKFYGVLDASVVVDYTVNYVDEAGNPLADSKTAKAVIGSTVTELAIDIEGRVSAEASKDITIDADSAKNVITFVYEKLPQVTVWYLDDAGNEVAPAKILYLPEGTVVTENVKEVAGYTYGGAMTQELTVVKGNANEIVFGNYLAIPEKETVKLPLTATDITWAGKSNQTYHNYGDLSALFDGDTSCPSQTQGFVTADWNSRNNSVIEINLGGIYDLNTLKIYWGNAKKWDFVPSKEYTISVAGADQVYGDPIYSFYDGVNTPGSSGLERNDFIDFGAEADFIQYIKIHSTDGFGRNPTIREIEVYASESVYSTDSARVTINHYDPDDNVIADTIILGDVLGTTYSIVPTEVPGYKYVTTADSLDFVLEEVGKNYVINLYYEAIPTVSELPAEEGISSTNATSVPFVFMTATPFNENPEAVFAVENWITNNCTVKSVEVVAADDPNTLIYEWKVTVTAVPNNNNPYSLTLDLPAEYELTDSFTFYREASDTLLDSAIATGETTFTFDKDKLILNYDESNTLKTEAKDRTIVATIDVQDILETGLPYKGYDEVSIELTGLESNGGSTKFNVKDFVNIGDGKFIGSIVATKAGVERLQATITLYGIADDGSKVVLDEATVFSGILEFTAKYPVPQTEYQKLMNYSFPVDILDQLFDQVHPFDLPTFSESEWDFYVGILKARGATEENAQAEIDRLKAEIERLKAEASDPNWVAPDYPDNIMIDNGRWNWADVEAKDPAGNVIKDANGNPVKQNEKTDYAILARVSTKTWNMLKDFHIESFSLRGKLELPSTTVMDKYTPEGMIDDAYVTFRKGVDYDYTNFADGDGFMIQVKIIGAQRADYTAWNINFGKAYNAIRRALKDDQLAPVLFRVDWSEWARYPFKGGVITVKLTEDWIDNYGLFNLCSYSMKGYSYGQDNDPTLTLIEEDFCVANPVTREVSVTFKGAAKLYDSYAIVSTNKLPSELPETIGTYFDAE